MPDRTAECITGEPIKLFSTFGCLNVLHSDQGQNFENAILAQALEVFGVKKSRTTSYHSQGNRMVERLNCTVLQLL